MSNTTKHYVYHTLSLKLHNPSQKKRAVMQQAMERYAAALGYLLNAAKERALLCESDDRTAQWAMINDFFKSGVMQGLDVFCVQPFKDALRRECTAYLMRYFGRQKRVPDTPYPAVGKRHPVQFCRHSAKREYALLYDTRAKRYYAKLHLLSRTDAPFETPRTIQPDRFAMVGGEIHLRSTSPRYLLAPLSFGRRQLAVLERARSGELRLKTARLVEKGGAFYLQVCVEIPVPAPYVPQAYMGVSRALGSLLCCVVCDAQGKILYTQQVHQPSGEKRTPQECLHIHARRVANWASAYRAQVVLSNLALRTDGIGWQEQRAQMNTGAYLAFADILTDYLLRMGAPEPIRVSPARLAYTCPYCGHVKRENRMFEDVFLCVRCGYASKEDPLLALNLAQRVIHYQNDPIPVTRRRVQGGVEYRNDTFGLCGIFAHEEDFFAYLRSLQPLLPYDARRASLIKRIQSAPDIHQLVQWADE